MKKETKKQTNKQKTSNNERKKSAALAASEAIRTTHGTNLMLNCRKNNSFAH